MASSDHSITLAQLLRVICPAAQISAGEHLLTRPVGWVVTLPPGSTSARAGDFVILSPPYASELSNTLAVLAARGAIGAAVFGDPPRDAIQAATAHALALAALPKDADSRTLEQAALELLFNKRAGLQIRAAEIYVRLSQMFVEGLGLDALAEELARVTRRIVLIQDKRLHPIAVSVPADLLAQWEQVKAELQMQSALPETLRDRKRAAQSPGALRQELRGALARLVAPIVAKNVARGYLSFVAPAAAFDEFDLLLVARGAAACALEMAKAKALREVEQRVRGDFVDALLAGNLSPTEASRWAERIAFPETGAYAAIALAWASAEHPTLRRLETVVSGELRAKTARGHAHAREDEIVIFVALDAARGIESARKLADKIYRQILDEFPHARVAMGLGRAVSDLLALRESYRQAQQARTMAARLVESNPLYFGDLSVYRLLFQMEHSPELESFCREILGSLIEYDRANKANLVETLSAYFAHRENVAQTARVMHLHRNSLLYRLTRIKEITGWDLNNPETRLAVQLALRAYRLVQVE